MSGNFEIDKPHKNVFLSLLATTKSCLQEKLYILELKNYLIY